jgi:hypothetical protein
VPGYICKYSGQPTLKKIKNFMLFVDHTTRLVYPSFQEEKSGAEVGRSKCDYETLTKHYNFDIEKYNRHNKSFSEVDAH